MENGLVWMHFFAYLACARSISCLWLLSYTLIFCVRPHPVCMDSYTSPQKKGWKGNGRGRAESGERGWEFTEDVNICPRSPDLTCPCSCIGWAESRGERKPGKEGRRWEETLTLWSSALTKLALTIFLMNAEIRLLCLSCCCSGLLVVNFFVSLNPV